MFCSRGLLVCVVPADKEKGAAVEKEEEEDEEEEEEEDEEDEEEEEESTDHTCTSVCSSSR